uniref:Response regulatory domain-containing protein n=1 Tax=Parastrongyloides trichosuri TaxID=131310 RepID=A0A0N4ZWK3_PARTI
MPISATDTHTEKHWSNVQVLLHRAIRKADMAPINVWSGEVIDRISERIVGNIFSHDIIVADISDLNPNVMLELGLRLASKKPTIVIANRGGDIPFDIRDFHVLQYPRDLNILEMEDFFDLLVDSLKAKHNAILNGTYEPFLGKVVVDVASPETRAIPMNELILERLDDLAKRLPRSDGRRISPPLPRPSIDRGIVRFRSEKSKSTAFFSLPLATASTILDQISSSYTTVTTIFEEPGIIYVAASSVPPRDSESASEAATASVVRAYDGETTRGHSRFPAVRPEAAGDRLAHVPGVRAGPGGRGLQCGRDRHLPLAEPAHDRGLSGVAARDQVAPDARRRPLRRQPHHPPDQFAPDGRHDGLGRGEGAADHHLAGRRARRGGCGARLWRRGLPRHRQCAPCEEGGRGGRRGGGADDGGRLRLYGHPLHRHDRERGPAALQGSDRPVGLGGHHLHPRRLGYSGQLPDPLPGREQDRPEVPARAQAGHGRGGQGLEDHLVGGPGFGRHPRRADHGSACRSADGRVFAGL